MYGTQVRNLHNLPDILNICDRPFSIKGTTDAYIYHYNYTHHVSAANGAVMLFELKKEANKSKHQLQAMLQLLCADYLSQFTPFVVLTDLNSDWYIYNIDVQNQQAVVVQRHFRHSNSAKKFIEDILRVEQQPLIGKSVAANMSGLPISVSRLSHHLSQQISTTQSHGHPMVDLLDDMDEQEQRLYRFSIFMSQLRYNPVFHEFIEEKCSEQAGSSIDYTNMFS